MALDLGSAAASHRVGVGLVELDPDASLASDLGSFSTLAIDRGVVLRGWSRHAGQRVGGVKLAALRGFSLSIPSPGGSPEMLPEAPALLGSIVRGGFAPRGAAVGAAETVDGTPSAEWPLAAWESDESWGASAGRPPRVASSLGAEQARRNPDGPAGLDLFDSLRRGFAAPSRSSDARATSPWSLRGDVAHREQDDRSGRLAFVSLMSVSNDRDLPQQAVVREVCNESGAPLGFEVLEVAFGSEDGASIQPFVAGRRQDSDSSCSAFGREVLGTAGVQFAAGDAWRCRVQVSQSFVDDVKERFEKPAFSVSLRRRF